MTEIAEAADAPPVPLLQGAFAIYRTPDDGVLLVWRKKGESADHPMPVPAFILKMAASQAGLDVDQLIAKIAAGDTE